MAVTTKKYLEYLDKEMTIMGILSAVSIAAPAGILNALLGDDKSGLKDRLWGAGPFFIVGGSVLCAIAALLFYRQRSRIAWYYGQMCLLESKNEDAGMSQKLREYMADIDSWAEWKSYSWGFDALVAGFVEYAAAVLLVLSKPYGGWFCTLRTFGFTAPCVASVLALLQWYVYNKYRFDDEYWCKFWSDVTK